MLGCLFLVDVSDFNQAECFFGSTSRTGQRIEKLSKVEHDLIKEVHPQVGEIKDGMDAMVAAVKENAENNSPASKNK